MSNHHYEAKLKCTNPSMTKQSFKDECDINKIMDKYQREGIIAHINNNEAQYGDIPAVSYHESMNIVAEANTMFEELPSLARKHFKNDPTRFLEFVQNPDNKEKLQEMGLAKADPSPLPNLTNPEPTPDPTPDPPKQTIPSISDE